MGIYHPNPRRGCGVKVHDACYAEAGSFSADGALWPWAWLLGDGLREYISMEISPRQIELINPILTILFKTKMGAFAPTVKIPSDSVWKYEKLQQAVKTPGIGDHVGTEYYSASSFAKEVTDLGPSRRITKSMAKALSKLIAIHGPVPMMFTHSEMPMFRHKEELGLALDHVSDMYQIDCNSLYSGPTWTHDNWGLYAREGQWTGHNHFMPPVLAAIDHVEKLSPLEDRETFLRARSFFRSLYYEEQPFGLSWLTQVSYTLPLEGSPDEDVFDLPGVNVIDLTQVEVFEDEPSENAPLGVD